MFPDGICRVSPRYYSKTIQFWDVNYQLAQQEDQTAIFDEWCSFLNCFDASIHFQFSFVNSSTDPDAFAPDKTPPTVTVPGQGRAQPKAGQAYVDDKYKNNPFYHPKGE